MEAKRKYTDDDVNVNGGKEDTKNALYVRTSNTSEERRTWNRWCFTPSMLTHND